MEIIKTYPLIFLLTVALPFFGGIITAYLGWDSLKGRFDDNQNKTITTEKLKKQDTIINKILSKEYIVDLGNKAIANGDREAYLKLTEIAKDFGKDRNVALSEIGRIKSHHYNMTSIPNIKLEIYDDKNKLVPENNLTTEKLIEILLLNPQYLFRARSAQILANRNEKYVHEALLLSIFSDNNIEILRESTWAFEKLTGYKSPDFFSPYGCLGFWYHNSKKVQGSIQKNNMISIIPFQKFEDKVNTAIQNIEYQEMLDWWETSLQLEEMLKYEHKIENKNRKQQ